MRSMACALHVVVLGFRRRLHGPESSPKREGARIAGGCGQPWAGHYPSQARLTSGNGERPRRRLLARVRGLRSEQGSRSNADATADPLKPAPGRTCSCEVLDIRPLGAQAVLGAEGMEHRPGRFDGLMRRQTAERDQTTAGLLRAKSNATGDFGRLLSTSAMPPREEPVLAGFELIGHP